MKVTQTVDDLTGIQTDTEELKVTVDGKSATLDLSPQSADALRALVAQDQDNPASSLFAAIFRAVSPAHGRTPSVRRSSADKPSGSGKTPEELAEIREWAKTKGFKVADKGRIAANIIAEYDAAHA